MTSLDGKGFSITLLKASAQMLEALDLPATSPGWTVTENVDRLFGAGSHDKSITGTAEDGLEKASTKSASQLKGSCISKAARIFL